MRVAAVHVDLAEHRKFDAVVDLAELFDFCLRAWLLCAKLVAGESEDHKPLVFVFFVDCLKTGVPRGKAALARGVDDGHYFAFVLCEALFFTAESRGAEFMYCLCHTGLEIN